MKNKDPFHEFAPAILRIYRRDKEAFWAAVMAPFLANQVSLLDWWQHLKVDVELLAAFRGLDAEAKRVLQEFTAPLGIDVTRWKSSREQYFKDAYPIFAFLAVWMDEMGLNGFLDRFDEILRSAVFGVAGYGILDENVDSASPSPVEVLTCQALICEYESIVLNVFGVTPVNLSVLHRMRSIFLAAEIREKNMRGKASPYRLDAPEDCGAKGAHVVTPFMLSLERLGKAQLIGKYWDVFLLFGAVIQIIDDWTDLENDLRVGHYSYVTLSLENFRTASPKQMTKTLRADTVRVRETYIRSKEMIARSRALLTELQDPFLVRLVDVTDLRLDSYFRKELKFIPDEAISGSMNG
jgi:hypothetical protein